MKMPLCFTCRHLDPDDSRGMVCAAFPEGIPRPIALAEVVHDRPYPGDHGIRYEPDPNEAGAARAPTRDGTATVPD